MKFSNEKQLYYSLLARRKMKKAAKVKKHLLKRVLKRRAKGKKLSAWHIVK
jgi:hypothetical protein